MKETKIIRSSKRKKTIQAKMKNNIFQVYLPTGLTKEEEQSWVNKMWKQYQRTQQKHTLNNNGTLHKRAQQLNTKYFNGHLKFTIEFVSTQNKRFGSCSPHTQKIRISDRIANMPRWVQDYVILHELTHLLHPNHSQQFWKKVNEYPRCERARGYLIAIGLESTNES